MLPAPKAASSMMETPSPEAYIGYARAENFISPGGAVKDASHVNSAEIPKLGQWPLASEWTIGPETQLSTKQAVASSIGFVRAICISFWGRQPTENKYDTA
jgi:Thioredoxin like C-terminal domain